jgi:hypothetical protein
MIVLSEPRRAAEQARAADRLGGAAAKSRDRSHNSAERAGESG